MRFSRMRMGCQIAAVALAGWYLLLPPTSKDFPMGNADAPLTQWVRRPTLYRDEKECEHVHDQQIRLSNGRNRQIRKRYYQQGKCVSADDPRLKPQ